MNPTHALLAALLTLTALAGCTADASDSTRIVIDFPEPHADVDDTVALAASQDIAGADVEVTAHHQLLAWSAASGTDVDVAEFSFGHCLDAIDHLPQPGGCQDGATAYWALSLNGQEAQVGMDDVALREGDVVTWTYTSLAGSSSADAPILAVDPLPPTQQDMVMLTGTLDRAAKLTVGNTTIDAKAGAWMVHVPLEYGRTPLLVTADDGMATSQTQVIAVRLASATFEAVFTAAVPPHATISDLVWYDPDELLSATAYAGKSIQHGPDANVHDLMATWERQSGKAIVYSYFDGLGFSPDKIDGVGQPLTASAPPYWCYKLNGESSDLGISVQTLAPGDVVTWEYAGCA